MFRDQHSGKAGDGKEICDLLVVFDRHVIIFSDKQCAFPSTNDLRLDWSRWFKRAISKSAEQISGAERWIKQFPKRVFVDRSCQVPLPIALPSPEGATYHRVVVAHGSGARCRTELGGSGSLMIVPSIVGAEHYNSQSSNLRPFAVGRLDESREFVHVIDDFSLTVLLETLDTITDFTKYLEKRAALLEGGRLIAAAGEEDLLAYYLSDIEANGEHGFRVPAELDGFVVDQGWWQSFENHPDRLAQVEANRISYNWDGLIDKFSQHLLDDTQYFASHSAVGEQEVGFRFLAREPRVRRRMLSKFLLGLVELGDSQERVTRYCPASSPQDPSYVFVSLRHNPSYSYDEYRELRRSVLIGCCLGLRAKFPTTEHIVGIATEPRSTGERRSEDFLYVDGRNWTKEQVDEAQAIRAKLDLLNNNVILQTMNEPAYPRARDEDMKKGRNRNRVCPCGSGRKYKRCCLA